MGCKCGNTPTETWQVNKLDGTSRTFSTEAEATVFAARNGGVIVRR